MIKTPIRINQIYKSKKSSLRMIICGKHNGKWRTKVLTDKEDVFNGSHSVTDQTLRTRYILIE